MNTIVQFYSFNTSTKAITFTGFSSISLNRIKLVTNVTANKIIYNFGDTNSAGASVSGNVLTLNSTTSLTGQNNTDELAIIYDLPTPSDYKNYQGSTATTIKASTGRLFGITAFNYNSAVRNLLIYDKASAPTGADTSLLFYPVPAAVSGVPGSITVAFGSEGKAFSTGIAIAWSSTANTYTAPATADQLIQAQYL